MRDPVVDHAVRLHGIPAGALNHTDHPIACRYHLTGSAWLRVFNAPSRRACYVRRKRYMPLQPLPHRVPNVISAGLPAIGWDTYNGVTVGACTSKPAARN